MQIIAQHRTPADYATRPGRVVLVKREHDLHPYVTGWLGDGDSQWCWGHYFGNAEEAAEDFRRRARRGF